MLSPLPIHPFLGVADALDGQLPLGLIVVKAGVETTEKALVPELVSLVRERIGPVADFKQALLVKRLPKTRSGRILRGTVRSMADGTPYKPPATMDDPAILDEIMEDLGRSGYPKE